MKWQLTFVFELLSVAFGLTGAAFWFLSAWADLPTAPGAAIGGTLPSHPFNQALQYSAMMNRWAAAMTCLSVLSLAGATFSKMHMPRRSITREPPPP